jgi:hypothetical protein
VDIFRTFLFLIVFRFEAPIVSAKTHDTVADAVADVVASTVAQRIFNVL